jgi:hypothetical protein
MLFVHLTHSHLPVSRINRQSDAVGNVFNTKSIPISSHGSKKSALTSTSRFLQILGGNLAANAIIRSNAQASMLTSFNNYHLTPASHTKQPAMPESAKISRLPLPTSSSLVTSKQDEITSNEEFIRGLVSGAASRAAKEILLHPIDTIRARQQAPGLVSSNQTISNVLTTITDLYSGITPALIGGIPAGAAFFGVKDYTKSRLKKIGLSKELATILAVGAANVPYWLIRTPAEALKTRQQVGNSSDSSFQALLDLYRSERLEVFLQSIYGSYASNYAYALPADIIKFVTCKLFRHKNYYI